MSGRKVVSYPNQLRESAWRLNLVVMLLGAFALIVAGKLAHIQIVQHGYYLALASEERWQVTQLQPPRGALLAADGAALALTVPFETLYADAANIKDKAKTAALLSPILGESEATLAAKLNPGDDRPVVLKRHLSAAEADRVRALHLYHLYFEVEPQRLHPEGALASQLLGFVGHEYSGLAGLEMSWDAEMSGEAGILQAEVDTAGDEIALALRNFQAPVGGADLVTTIDRFAQRLAERELEAAIKRHKADSGTVIILEPSTGSLLALASRPTYSLADPNYLSPANEPLYRLPAVSDAYEPGSVFKVVTMASGLDAGAVSANESYEDRGFVVEGGVTIRNWDGVGHGQQTMAQILQRSLNTGSSYVAKKLGAAKFYEYVRAFGFGAPSGVDLPGEAAGLIRDHKSSGWSGSDLLTNSFGQGIAVTPLQMARAVSVVANEGRLMAPRIVSEIRSASGTQVVAPKVLRQVISPATARIVTDMMVNAVDKSVVGLAQIDGYKVAGKSGTAEILVNGRYSPQDTVASLVGFAPADSPRFLVLVAITRPKDNIWGEAVAAPIFRTIMSELLDHAGVAPSAVVGQR
ncbi:MAG: peptidoglycan D,D-transpeptidase FtsI family protein [Chloroflexota bacterium]